MHMPGPVIAGYCGFAGRSKPPAIGVDSDRHIQKLGYLDSHARARATGSSMCAATVASRISRARGRVLPFVGLSGLSVNRAVNAPDACVGAWGAAMCI